MMHSDMYSYIVRIQSVHVCIAPRHGALLEDCDFLLDTPSLHLQVSGYRFIVAVVKTCKEMKHANRILIWDKHRSSKKCQVLFRKKPC